ncbi:DUF4283 domain-containing protein [Raphanus sativus]|nr:DUF4283 domain-containing protein [Raphanus sativus]
MFHVAQWSDGEVADTSSLEAIPIWAHLTGVPFDLMTNEGLGWIADALGDPKEMDDWTKNLSSLSVAHVKVEADATKPFHQSLSLFAKVELSSVSKSNTLAPSDLLPLQGVRAHYKRLP